jgi:hypothetical protein
MLRSAVLLGCCVSGVVSRIVVIGGQNPTAMVSDDGVAWTNGGSIFVGLVGHHALLYPHHRRFIGHVWVRCGCLVLLVARERGGGVECVGGVGVWHDTCIHTEPGPHLRTAEHL